MYTPPAPPSLMPWYIFSQVKSCQLASACSSAVVFFFPLLFAQSTFPSICRHSAYSSSNIKYLLLLRFSNVLLTLLSLELFTAVQVTFRSRSFTGREWNARRIPFCMHASDAFTPCFPTLVSLHIRYSERWSLLSYLPNDHSLFHDLTQFILLVSHLILALHL